MLPPVVLVLQPPQYGTHSYLAFATLPLPFRPFIAFFRLTASSRPSAPPSDLPKCLRFGHWLTLCTLNMQLLTYLLTVENRQSRGAKVKISVKVCNEQTCAQCHAGRWHDQALTRTPMTRAAGDVTECLERHSAGTRAVCCRCLAVSSTP